MKSISKMFIACLSHSIGVLGRICDRIYSCWYSIQLKACGKTFRVRMRSVIISPENITIGSYFNSKGNLYMYGSEGEIIIGDRVAINTNVQIGASGGRIIIGNNVIVASNVVIRCANHGVKASELIRDQSHTSGAIIIEDDVWIGANSVITPNVTLAKGTVVGAGAVVTKSTEPYNIVGGVPARKICQRN